jgi:hypothetical protein
VSELVVWSDGRWVTFGPPAHTSLKRIEDMRLGTLILLLMPSSKRVCSGQRQHVHDEQGPVRGQQVAQPDPVRVLHALAVLEQEPARALERGAGRGFGRR